MDTLTFISSIVSSLAWPTAAVILAVLFRVPLQKAFDRLKTAEVPGFKAEFEDRLKQAEKQADKAALPPAPPAPEHDDRPPSSRIFESWRELEAYLNDMYMRHKGSRPRYTDLREFLYELGSKSLIPRESIAIFNDLRGIRNQAVHPRGEGQDVTSLQADEFANLTARLMQQLKLIDSAPHALPKA